MPIMNALEYWIPAFARMTAVRAGMTAVLDEVHDRDCTPSPPSQFFPPALSSRTLKLSSSCGEIAMSIFSPVGSRVLNHFL